MERFQLYRVEDKCRTSTQKVMLYKILIAMIVIFLMFLLVIHLTIRRYKRMLLEMRDSADLTTANGKVIRDACNSKLDQLNGLKPFNVEEWQ